MLGVNRSTYYYKPASESEENLLLMRMIDEEYTRRPFYGSRQMTFCLRNSGYLVNRKRVQRLMRQMGLEGICPKRKLSKGENREKKYPYLLKEMSIEERNQVWSTDITYIRLSGGFLYLVAIIDWYSRYVISWRLSNSMDIIFCLEAAEEALEKGCPNIMNSDQGSQFTSEKFTKMFEKKGALISWDGRGRALDNIFVERFWRSLKYEEVYLKEYKSVREAKRGIERYMDFYNNERPHQSLDGRRPQEVFWGTYRPMKELIVGRSRCGQASPSLWEHSACPGSERLFLDNVRKRKGV